MDEYGFYVTSAQINFFANRWKRRPNRQDNFADFVKYINFCKFYNCVSDCMDKDSKSACMYWDQEAETIGFKFPANGKVAKLVKKYCDYDEFL